MVAMATQVLRTVEKLPRQSTHQVWHALLKCMGCYKLICNLRWLQMSAGTIIICLTNTFTIILLHESLYISYVILLVLDDVECKDHWYFSHWFCTNYLLHSWIVYTISACTLNLFFVLLIAFSVSKCSLYNKT